MNPTFVRVGRSFAATARGIDLTEGIDARIAAAIEDALAEHGVVVFPGQPLDDAAQADFIAHFGPPPQNSMINTLKKEAVRSPYFFDVATVKNDGTPIEPDSPYGLYMRANLL